MIEGVEGDFVFDKEEMFVIFVGVGIDEDEYEFA